jgi:hypothetical protein
MFNLFGKKPKPEPKSNSMRDTLFGDLPMEQWPSANAPGANLEPWSRFVQARDALSKGKKTDAIAHWQRITDMPNLESRHYVQAWNFLRGQGVEPPPDKAKQVYGVVVEVPMQNAYDLLAAYPDGSARYYNYSGAGIVWEHPDTRLDDAISALMEAGRQAAAKIGPWEGPRPPAPTNNVTRLSMLTPSGLHFGQANFNVLAADAIGAPVILAATALMQQLTQLRTQ